MSTFPLPSMAWGVSISQIKGERMEKMEMGDLDKLIEAVEAGAAEMWSTLREGLGPSLGGDAYDAYCGSLDAAKRLHDALLPGWKWDVTLHAASVEEPNRRFSPQFPMEGLWSGACDDPPARAWLLAILRAVKAKGERG